MTRISSPLLRVVFAALFAIPLICIAVYLALAQLGSPTIAPTFVPTASPSRDEPSSPKNTTVPDPGTGVEPSQRVLPLPARTQQATAHPQSSSEPLWTRADPRQTAPWTPAAPTLVPPWITIAPGYPPNTPTSSESTEEVPEEDISRGPETHVIPRADPTEDSISPASTVSGPSTSSLDDTTDTSAPGGP